MKYTSNDIPTDISTYSYIMHMCSLISIESLNVKFWIILLTREADKNVEPPPKSSVNNRYSMNDVLLHKYHRILSS